MSRWRSKELTKLGNAHIALGMALKNPSTKISTLVSRAFDCGLRLTIAIRLPESAQPKAPHDEPHPDPQL